MKTITSLKFFITIIAIATFMLIVKSCKKVDKNVNANTTEAEATKAAAIKAFKDKYGNVSAGTVININKAANEYFYRDANGKMVSLYGNNSTNGAPGVGGISGPSVCKADCSTTSNPADLRVIYTLDYVQRFFGCESNSGSPVYKSTVSVKWTVSVPFQIGYTNNNYPPLHYGDVRFKNSSGTVINTLTATNGQVTSTMLGADPSCSTWNNLWEVTYTFTQVNNSNFVSGNTIEASVSLENDCALLGNVVTSGYVSAPAFSQNAYLPCNRVDFLLVTPASSGFGTKTIALGNAAFGCTTPSGLVYGDLYQLEYRAVNGSTLNWADQTSTVFWAKSHPSTPYTLTPTMSVSGELYLEQMTIGSGQWLVRYRNVDTGTCGVFNSTGFPNENWGNPALWVTEVITL